LACRESTAKRSIVASGINEACGQGEAPCYNSYTVSLPNELLLLGSVVYACMDLNRVMQMGCVVCGF
jgi:hypothetical protein